MQNKPAAQVHPIPPCYDEGSRVLILGSFPSVKSREAAFFYGHPQNRYWKVIARVCGENDPAVTDPPRPENIPAKREFLRRHHIAMWDTIGSCTITGSSDSSIRDVVPNDLSVILDAAPVRQIFCNGTASFDLYRKHILPVTGREAVKLPSTSPANAAWSPERLYEAWKIVGEYLEE